MTIQDLHYGFKLAKNRIDTLANQDFNIAEIDWFLNEAQLMFVKQRFSDWNNKRTGFEANSKRIHDLSSIIIKYPLQPGLTPIEDSGIYELDLSTLSYPYLFYLSGAVDIEDEDSCLYNAPLKFIQHDDYREALRDPFNSPSLEFIPFNFGRSSSSTFTSLYIYPGDYTVNTVYVEYLRYPSRISYGTYTYLDGVNYPTATSELPEHTHTEIIDLACQVAALASDNPDYIQLKNLKISVQE